MANLTRDGFEMQQKFRKEKRRRLKNKAGLNRGAAVSASGRRKEKIKEIGRTVGRGISALTPGALGRTIGKAILPPSREIRDPVRPRRPRKSPSERFKEIREKIRKGKIKPIPMPDTSKPLGSMKKPRPGTYDYQLQQTLKPGYRVAPMLTGGQAKLDKNKNNKIDAQDFKILRAEKAKGRGMGLQDEKMKPGKVKKAVVGMLAVGMGAKKNMAKRKAPMALGAAGAATAKLGLMKRILGLDKGGMGEAKNYKKYLSGLERVTSKTRYDKAVAKRKALEASKPTTSKFIQRRMTLAGKEALKAAKATRIGKIAAGVAGAALLAKAGLEKMYEKRTGKKAPTKRPDKKMGGGLMEATQKLKAQGKMGGGMMQRPMMAMGGGMMPGYKKGKSVMAKGCKLGRKKPTKMYT